MDHIIASHSCLTYLTTAGSSISITQLTLSVPDEPQTELDAMSAYRLSHKPIPGSPLGLDGRPHLLLDYAAEEIRRQERIVEFDESGWMAVVPFWATWPFELLGTSPWSLLRSDRLHRGQREHRRATMSAADC